MLGATDLTTAPTTLCGYRTESVTYTAPPWDRYRHVKPPYWTWRAPSVTRPTSQPSRSRAPIPNNPTYARDAKTILTGFQMLPPDAA